MYNRYIRQNGAYQRVPQPEPTASPPLPKPPREEPPRQAQQVSHRSAELGFLDKILSRLHLGDVDSGDLILLLLLFFLFKEDGDEELLIAIGLLLIL